MFFPGIADPLKWPKTRGYLVCDLIPDKCALIYSNILSSWQNKNCALKFKSFSSHQIVIQLLNTIDRPIMGILQQGVRAFVFRRTHNLRKLRISDASESA